MRKLVLLVAICAAFQHTFSQNLDSAAIHRIADYGKVWAVLTLFHPEMAYNRVNADSLFTDPITELLNEPNAGKLKNAIQKMVDRLGDPYTTIENNLQTQSERLPIPQSPLLRWLPDSTALLRFDDGFIQQNFFASSPSLLQLIDTLEQAQGIVIDLREPTPVVEDYSIYYKQAFLKQLIGHLVDRPLGYPAYRSRIHYGHESQSIDVSFYYQGWFVQNSSLVQPKQKTIRKPICLLVNKYSNVWNEGIAAIQSEGIAKVIADESLGNFDPVKIFQMQLADNLKLNIRMSEMVLAGSRKTFAPDSVVVGNDLKTDNALLQTATYMLKSNSKTETAFDSPTQNWFTTSKVAGYDNLSYPPAPLRLLGLMRFWSAINYFCPNKNLITKNWDNVLYEYVPKFLAAKDSVSYALTAAKLIKEINDGHGFFSSPVILKMIPSAPEVQLKNVENKTIFYRVFNDSSKKSITPGDEITAVDGTPIKIHRDSIMQYMGASNDAARQYYITPRVLAGPTKSFVNVTYLHNGIEKTIRLQRTVPRAQYYNAPQQNGPVWKNLNEKLGYVDLGRLQVDQVDSMFHDLANTEAIIIDDRSYPNGTAWYIVNYLTDKNVRAAIGTTMIADSPDPLTVTEQETVWEIPVNPKPRYNGKIIVLVNETTQSQAEYSCMVLQAAYKKVTIIGSQTAGADGDITDILLPGGIRTAFSGHGVHYPDRRPTQGIGIVPDIKVTPTIEGIRKGKDEVLERAIFFAKNGK